MKTVLISFFLTLVLTACHNLSDREHARENEAGEEAHEEKYDPSIGEGKWTNESLILSEKINEQMAAEGAKIQEKKCAQCHSTGSETLVGPGWKGVTKRRTAAWIMNYIRRPEGMIDKDPGLRAHFEKCSVRMPNLNLTDAEARKLLEFLRKNDAMQN
jgi:mono/diheme cytochrome c family protein